jgi:hypothetical protein
MEGHPDRHDAQQVGLGCVTAAPDARTYRRNLHRMPDPHTTFHDESTCYATPLALRLFRHSHIEIRSAHGAGAGNGMGVI